MSAEFTMDEMTAAVGNVFRLPAQPTAIIVPNYVVRMARRVVNGWKLARLSPSKRRAVCRHIRLVGRWVP